MRHVIDEARVEPWSEAGDTAETRVVFGPDTGCKRLEQRVIRFARGRSRPRRLDGRQEVLYVVSGSGRLVVNGEPVALAPDTGAYLASGDAYEVESFGDEPLTVVSVLCRQEQAPPSGSRGIVVRFAEREELVADENRSFRYLVNEDLGCLDVTQFVGIVKPCRAPDHSHPYDEVGYVVEGRGYAHVGGASTPIGPGSCFHLPPGAVHCIENTGPSVMRILGVFHPSGSPKQRTYEDKQRGARVVRT